MCPKCWKLALLYICKGDLKVQKTHNTTKLYLKWLPAPVFLPGEARGQRSLVGYSPLGRNEWDRTDHVRINAWDQTICSIMQWFPSHIQTSEIDWSKWNWLQLGRHTLYFHFREFSWSSQNRIHLNHLECSPKRNPKYNPLPLYYYHDY